MKKSVSIVLALMLVFGIILASAPLQAQAKPLEVAMPNPLIAGGSWTTGSSVDVTTLAASAPTWLQLLTGGVKVTEAGKICHPFRGGQFGWAGVIMQYKDGKWVKLTTTDDWVPNKEGEFMSCAQAPAAGTYALFGYWKRPAGSVDVVEAPLVCDYDTSSWSGALEGGDNVYNLKADFGTSIPVGTTVSYIVTNVTGDVNPAALIGMSGSTIVVSEDNEIWGHFSEQTFSPTGNGVWYIYFTVTAGGCSKDLVASFT